MGASGVGFGVQARVILVGKNAILTGQECLIFETRIDCPVAIADELGSSKQEGETLAAA